MNEHVKWYSLKEVSEHLNIGRETIILLIKEQGLPAYKVGNKWRFDIKEVDRWVKEQHRATFKD